MFVDCHTYSYAYCVFVTYTYIFIPYCMFVIHNTKLQLHHLGRMTFVPDREDRPGTKVIHCGDVLLRHRKLVHVHVLVVYFNVKLAIIGRQVYSDTQTRRENCVNIRRYHKTVAEVRGTWCTKNDARALFPVGARSDKMAVRTTSIFGKVYVFSDTAVCAFSEAAFGEILASIRCPKTSPIRNIFW